MTSRRSSRFPNLPVLFFFFFILLIQQQSLLVQVSAQSQPEQQQPQCAVNVRNSREKCSKLLSTTTEECECYIFCDEQVVSCARFGEQVPFACVGSTVAGCTRDMLLPLPPPPPPLPQDDSQSSEAAPSDEQQQQQQQQQQHTEPLTDDFFPMPPEDDNDKKEACSVTVNARDAICADYMSHMADSVDCDCYNFCNGKLIGCLEFGERTTFSCSGETVAGCLQEQKHFGTGTNSAAVNLNHQSSKTTVLLLSIALSSVVAVILE